MHTYFLYILLLNHMKGALMLPSYKYLLFKPVIVTPGLSNVTCPFWQSIFLRWLMLAPTILLLMPYISQSLPLIWILLTFLPLLAIRTLIQRYLFYEIDLNFSPCQTTFLCGMMLQHLTHSLGAALWHLHSMSHLEVKASLRLIKARYFCPYLDNEICMSSGVPPETGFQSASALQISS